MIAAMTDNGVKCILSVHNPKNKKTESCGALFFIFDHHKYKWSMKL